MAEVVAGDAASVFAVDHGVRVVCPVWIFASEWMVVDIAACGVNMDAVHGCARREQSFRRTRLPRSLHLSAWLSCKCHCEHHQRVVRWAGQNQ